MEKSLQKIRVFNLFHKKDKKKNTPNKTKIQPYGTKIRERSKTFPYAVAILTISKSRRCGRGKNMTS